MIISHSGCSHASLHFDYTSNIYLHKHDQAASTNTLSSKLISLECRAERIIGQKVPTVENITSKKTVFVRKCLDGDICSNFQVYFEMRNHRTNTKNNGKLY